MAGSDQSETTTSKNSRALFVALNATKLLCRQDSPCLKFPRIFRNIVSIENKRADSPNQRKIRSFFDASLVSRLGHISRTGQFHAKCSVVSWGWRIYPNIQAILADTLSRMRRRFGWAVRLLQIAQENDFSPEERVRDTFYHK